ncbi:MAG: DUF177 domain-containing protein [Bacteroidaceae bacterium]|nr:DUF177 domain-containing protein [Bacteroidaceae bacterium]
MGRFDKYNIDLKGLKAEPLNLEFILDDAFFGDIEGEEFRRGKVKAVVTAKKNRDVFDIAFSLSGIVIVPCNRCLDDLELEIETTNSLRVRLGDDFADDGDIVVVPEHDGDINIAWYLYEFIALAMPMRRVHAPGKCNKAMTGKLRKHLLGEYDDEQPEMDPRWEVLKNIQIEEDN